MDHVIGVVGTAVVLFAATNVDDIFVLLFFFSDPEFRARHVVIGQYLGIAALYGASVLASLIALVVSAAYIGLLGLVPIVLGLRKLWRLRAGSQPDRDSGGHETVSAGHGNIVAVALLTIANGGDNISIYTPMFATRTIYEIAVIGLIFCAMTAAWLGMAYYLRGHPAIGAPIRRHGHRMMPFVLVALGIIILYDAGTIRLFY